MIAGGADYATADRAVRASLDSRMSARKILSHAQHMLSMLKVVVEAQLLTGSTHC